MRAFIEWGMTYPQEYAFCFLRIQQDLLVRGEVSGGRADALFEVALEFLQGVRKAGYPVRQIADAALLTMAVGLVGRAVIDQSSFGAISLEEKIQQMLDVCFGVVFAQPVHTVQLTLYSRKQNHIFLSYNVSERSDTNCNVFSQR